MNLAEYVSLNGDERVAEELSALLGKDIRPGVVKMWAAKERPPKTWAEALRLEQPPPPPKLPPDAELDEDEEGRRAEATPRPPQGTKFVAPLVKSDFAEKRIAKAYSFLGFGVGTALGNEGVTVVWDDHAPEIARAWVEAAETSEFARRFLGFMTAGGPMGEVAMLHLSLVGATLYVIGSLPEIGVYGKYNRYRPKPVAPAAQGAPTADVNGAAPPGADAGLGAAARPAGG